LSLSSHVEVHAMPYDIRSEVLPEQLTAVIMGTVPFAEVGVWLPAAYDEVFAALARQGLDPVGQPFARYDMRGDHFVMEAGAAVALQVVPEGRVVPGTLPGGPVAITTHLGPYDQLGDAVDALTTWVVAQGSTPAGAHWEIYYSDPILEPDPASWRTDVLLPMVAEPVLAR
jgi:effector-binding domain-containing protein